MSALLVTFDVTTRLLEPVRGIVGTAVSPLQVLAEAPYLLADEVGEVTSSHEMLRLENAELTRRILELSQISQQFLSLKTENERLRALLGSRSRIPAEVLVAELIGVVPVVNTHQVIIDKGAESGISIGQAVLDAQGLFGQIVEVDQFTSRVLLIVDTSHAIPVQVNRSGVRSVAGGTGELHRLELENLPVTADIREGDLMESSGLGGRFPRGYPVGYVGSVIIEDTSPYAQVNVIPLAALDRARHVLVVFDKQRRQLEDLSAGSVPADDSGFTDPLEYEDSVENGDSP